MNEDAKLRLQAWVDGELSATEARDLARLTQDDPEAAAVVRELRLVRSLLADNELVRTVPESRAFHWARIERELTSPDDRVTARETGPWRIAIWLRWLVPAGVAAALVFAMLTAKAPAPQDAALRPAEIDSHQEDLGSITFRSDTEQMTVIWVNDP